MCSHTLNTQYVLNATVYDYNQWKQKDKIKAEENRISTLSITSIIDL